MRAKCARHTLATVSALHERDVSTAGRHRWLPVAVVSAVAVCAYLNALSNGFVWDDVYQVVENPWIRNGGHLREIFGSHVWGCRDHPSNYYRPLMHVANAAVVAIVGTSAWALHGLSVLLHAATTLLVYVLAVRLGTRRRAAVAAALVFAVHPVHVEAVAWISAVPDVACAALYALAVLLYLDAARAPDQATWRHAAAATAFLGAALFKEPGVTLPAVVALVDLRTPPHAARRFWLERYGWMIAAAGAYLGLRHAALGGLAPHASESSFTLIEAMNTAGAAALRYLSLLVWPWPLNAFRTGDDALGLPSWTIVLAVPLVALAWRHGGARAACGLGLLIAPLLPALYAPALLPGLDNPWAERSGTPAGSARPPVRFVERSRSVRPTRRAAPTSRRRSGGSARPDVDGTRPARHPARRRAGGAARRYAAHAHSSEAPAIASLARNGFVDEFTVHDGALTLGGTGRSFRPEELRIRDHFRFEGTSDPDDMSVIYALEARDGTRGILVDAFGAYADPTITAVVDRIPMERWTERSSRCARSSIAAAVVVAALVGAGLAIAVAWGRRGD